MSTFFRSALVLVALLASTSATMARTYGEPRANESVRQSVNSPDSVRAFWDDMQRSGN